MSAPRHPFHLTARDAALVVVDFQQKLAATVPDDVRAETVRRIRTLLEAAALLGVQVLATEQYPRGLGPTAPEVAELLPGEPIAKVAFDCCAAEGFLERLRATKARKVVLVGMEAHICVLQTALGLLAAGYRVWVAQDAVCSRRDENRRAGLDLAWRAGAVVAPTETLLFMLLERSGTAEFKELSRLIREP